MQKHDVSHRTLVGACATTSPMLASYAPINVTVESSYNDDMALHFELRSKQQIKSSNNKIGLIIRIG